MPNYTILENTGGGSLNFGINDGFYLTGFGWDEENDRFQAEFTTSKSKFPLRIIFSEPSPEYVQDVNKAAQKQSMVLTHIVSRFVPLEKLKAELKDGVTNFKTYVEKLRKQLPRGFEKIELEVVLRYNNNGYLAMPKSIGGLPQGFMRVKASDQPKLEVTDWFTETFGTKPTVPEASAVTSNSSGEDWGIPF